MVAALSGGTISVAEHRAAVNVSSEKGSSGNEPASVPIREDPKDRKK